MKILDGKKVSDIMLSDVKEKINSLCENNAISRPSIAIVIVGNNPASETYVKAKMKASEKAGINSKLIRFDDTISNFDLYNEIIRLNKSSLDGFIVQLPLQDHIDKDAIIHELLRQSESNINFIQLIRSNPNSIVSNISRNSLGISSKYTSNNDLIQELLKQTTQ